MTGWKEFIFALFLFGGVVAFIVFLMIADQNLSDLREDSINLEMKWMDDAPIGSEIVPRFTQTRNYALTHGWKIKGRIEQLGEAPYILEKWTMVEK